MSALLSVDYSLMMAQNLGDSGISTSAWADLQEPLTQATSRALDRISSGEVGFAALPDDMPGLAKIDAYVESWRAKADSLLVLGIGGSSQGPRALTDALAPWAISERVHYVDNADPDTLMGTLRRLNPERTLVNVVSKSGGTVETLAGYLITREWLESHLGEEEARNRLVFTTDPETGFLHDIAGKEGITMFPIPTNVGGRFSVLSAVGLLPASFAGIDTGTLLKGARTMREHCAKVDPTQNPAAITAGIHFLMDTALGRHNTVFWVYADALRSTADWFAQLWGESLGKTKGIERIGPTPIPAVGATDQHSQLQLYMDGPDNKGIWFVEVGKFGQQGSIPSLHPDAPETAYLGGLSLESLLHAERRATALALGQAGKPNGTIHLRDCSPACLGALLFFLQMQTAITGELYEIDPYDQPGVEAGKVFTYGLMNREGFDAQKGQLEEAEDQHIPHVITVEVDDNASSG